MANEGVKVRPHPAAGSRVVLPQGGEKEAVVVEEGGEARISKSLFAETQKKENYARPTQAYPEGYPLLVEDKEES